ncbi:Fc.00g028230.m01.CDS01 [Cosmosporella sp. VM-42]
MDDSMKAIYEMQSRELRNELKVWEADWQKAHDGKKPSRDAIKANPDIAAKYKQYAKIRNILDGKIPPPSKETSEPRKRKPEPIPAETPSKRSRYAETPSKDRIRDEKLMNTPGISRKLFSPAASVTSLGPTPQRDGRVLGLFDLLVERELGTPSKNDGSGKMGRRNSITATPSKRMISTDEESTPRLGRTPMSTSKRQMLNSFMTPLKNRDNNAGAFTPGSVSKLQFDTPAFLKRHSLPALDENGEFDAPAPLRLPRKPLGRGLSEIVASLRKVEDDVLDDELEALRDAENEEMGVRKPTPPPQPKERPLGEDVEIQKLPLGGFDDESMYDSQGEERAGLDHRGNPLRVFKKKGQKRTTRKVNMRPTRTKRPVDMSEGHQSGSDYEDAIPETQPGAEHAGSDSEFEGTKAKKTAAKPAKKEGTVKKATRKVNELAHANFQKLKLKNYGAKGGPGFNSRFRRRR